ncbi:MAG: helix-turn-helix transcriptional regulator [Bacteroidales bacterium]|nr:helix-turn-helix transcriptional regulator [Bacteroidales bacterium]
MIDRINMLLKAKNITVSQFSQAIKIQRSGMSHILSGRNKPSLDFVLRVLKRYPEINPSWFLMGEGEMYISDKIDTQTTMFPSQLEIDDAKEIIDVDEHKQEPINNELIDSQNRYLDNENITMGRTNTKKIEKIIVLYSDNTFDEYLKG